MRGHCKLRIEVLLASAILVAAPAAAVTVKIEYDAANLHGLSSPFFNSGTPQAVQAKAALNAAAAYYSTILNDTLAAILPPTYSSPRVTVTWGWTLGFSNTVGSGSRTLSNEAIPADEIRVYAGAQTFSGNTLAQGGFGSHSTTPSRTVIGNPNSTDITQMNAIEAQFISAYQRRNEPTNDFARWGGALSFDNDTNWHFSHTTPPPAGTTDFYSVSVHELGHVLGFGGAPEFDSLIKPAGFDGALAKAAYGGPVPLTGDGGHWGDGVTSTVYGAGTSQTAIMVSTFPPTTRRQLTTLDAAALSDIGWSVVPPPTPPGDYNRNGVVDAADYALWRNTLNQSVTPGTGADGSGNGTIGNEDYTFWRARFGNTLGSASGSSLGDVTAFVPEPAGVVLLIGASLIMAIFPPTIRIRR